MALRGLARLLFLGSMVTPGLFPPFKSLVSPWTFFRKSSHSRASFIVGDRLDLSRFLYSIVQEQCPELEQSRGFPDYDIVLYRR